MHASTKELHDSLGWLGQAPSDGGPVAALCVRPGVDERVEVQEVLLTPEGGMAGDRWASTCKERDPDGGPARDLQLTLMAVRAIEPIARSRERWALAGDQVFLDLDLSEANLPVGTRLALGEAEIEIVAEPHLGCSKFGARFGQEAMRFVCRKDLRPLRLRGVYARIVKAGVVRVGDRAVKVAVRERAARRS